NETHLLSLAAVDHTRLHLTDDPATAVAANITSYRQQIAALQAEVDRAMWALNSEARSRLRVRDIDQYFLIRSAQCALLECLYRAEAPASYGSVISLLSDLTAEIRNDVSQNILSANDLDRLLTTVRQCERIFYDAHELCALTALLLEGADVPVDRERLSRI